MVIVPKKWLENINGSSRWEYIFTNMVIVQKKWLENINGSSRWEYILWL